MRRPSNRRRFVKREDIALHKINEKIFSRQIRLVREGQEPVVMATSEAIKLSDVPPAPRGVPQIEVTFDIDANGIMNISAKDKGTGKEQSIKIEASSGLSEEEIEQMKAEAEANAESDAKIREEVELVNKADSLIFQTERQLKEYGDKLPADKKAPIEEALAELKTEFEAKHMGNLEPAMEKLNTIFSAASEEMYNAGNAEGGDAGAQDAGAAGDEVTDVDFEEVKEEVEEK